MCNVVISKGWWVMRTKSTLLISILMICVVFTSCQKTMKPDTPQNTAWLMKLAIDNGDYERFNNLLSEKNIISRDSFDEMKNKTTAVAGYIHYELITFENGEMLLVRLTPEKVNGEYKIEDVIIVPNEMKEIFK